MRMGVIPMKFGQLPIVLALSISKLSLAQVVEQVDICTSVPLEFIGYGEGACVIRAGRNHLVVEIADQNEVSGVMKSIYDAMVSNGFNALSENAYWYPDSGACYFSWYGIGTTRIVFVPSEKQFGLGSGVPYCGHNPQSYDSTWFRSVIEQELVQDGLLDLVSINFSTIEVDSELYEKVLDGDDTLGLFTLDGDIVTIDIQY